MRQLVVAVVAGLLATLVWPIPASADTTCQLIDPTTGRCVIRVEPPPPHADDGARDTGAGQRCYFDPKRFNQTTPSAGPVPCTKDFGYWSNHYMCYIKALQPQPPATDPAWRGHQPGDGAVYDCYTPQTQVNVYIWSQNQPPGALAGPSPREVAEIAIDQMDLRAVDIGITPEPSANSVGIVGMPVWMWAANPDSHTVGPISAAASAGGITINATARLHRVSWSMGDGTTVRCSGRGTPYQASYGKKESPDCGHVYTTSSSRKPHGTYTVTATSDWVVQWSGAGQTGTIRLNGLQRSTSITIGEAQVLVQ